MLTSHAPHCLFVMQDQTDHPQGDPDHDLAAHHAADGALRASEARYRHLVDTLRTGILVSDAEGVVRLSNRVAEQIVGPMGSGWVGTTVPAGRLPWFDED